MARQLIILCGLPFSGKSTLAAALSTALSMAVLSYDHDIYERYKQVVPPGTSKVQEYEMVEAIARRQLGALLTSGESVIYDDLSLENEDRRLLKQLAGDCGARSIIVYVDTPLSVIEERREANRQKEERGHTDDASMQLDISLLQPPQPQSEDVVVVRPGDDVEGIVLEIRRLLTRE